MSNDEPQDPNRPGGGGNGPAYVGPAAPVPPRSRAGDHLVGAGLAVLGSVVAIAALVVSLSRLFPSTVPPTASTNDPVILLAVVLAGGALGSIAAWGGRSAAAPAVAGGIWTVLGVIGLLPGRFVGELLARLPDVDAGGDPVDLVLRILLTSAVPLFVGATFLGLAFAASVARRRGRAAERAEQRLHEGGAVTTPPRPRILGHIGAVVLAVVGTVVAIAVLGGVADTIVSGRQTALPDLAPALALALVAGLLAAASGAVSSLGPTTAGAIWLVSLLPSVIGGRPGPGPVSETVGPVLTDLLDVLGRSFGYVNGGPSWALALLLIGGAAGSHHARRSGRAAQRQELQHIRSQDVAWSDGGV